MVAVSWPPDRQKVEAPILAGMKAIFSLNRDATEAYLEVEKLPPSFDFQTTLAAIRMAVLENFPGTACVGFLSEELPELLDKGVPFFGKMIAAGRKPTEGRPPRVDFIVPRPSGEFLLRADGSMDYKSQDRFRSVAPGETIAVLHPPVPGLPGKTVFDKEIPAPASPEFRILAGNHVSLISETDGRTTARADSFGQVVWVSGPRTLTVSISPVLDIKGDVDLSSGNINFKGSAVVHGAVRSGFTVAVTGNLTVLGNIEPGAKITAGGDLVVFKGILGTGMTAEVEPEIKAFGGIKALFAENVRMTAQGDIQLGAAMNSHLSSNGMISVVKSIVGGSVTSFKSVEVGEIGNAAGTRTEILCGVSHTDLKRLNLVVKILDDVKNQSEAVEKNLKFLQEGTGVLQGDMRVQVLAMMRQRARSLQEQILKLELKKADLALLLLEETHATVSGMVIHAGTTVTIRSSRHAVSRDLFSTSIGQKLPEETIEFRPYLPRRRSRNPSGGASDPA